MSAPGIVDIVDMPDYNPAVKNEPRSVSEGKVAFGRTPWMAENGSLETIYCKKHGAMLRVGDCIWRCPTCNVGAYQTNPEWEHEEETRAGELARGEGADNPEGGTVREAPARTPSDSENEPTP